MNTSKKIARTVGALFIITMIAGCLNSYLIEPILNTSFTNIYQNEIQVLVGAFLNLVMSVGIVGIAVVLFPILKPHNEIIAIGYVSVRMIECALLITGSIIYLFLIGLSQEYINTGTPDASYFQTLFTLAHKMKNITYQIAMIILGFGSLFLCYLLFQSKLVPRFIAVWGFIGYVLLFVSGLLDILGVIDTVNGMGVYLYIPGGIWEVIALPLWLIIKGFNPAAVNVGKNNPNTI
jgi:hypothetical protein